MRVFKRGGNKLDPHEQHKIGNQTLPAGWMLTAGAQALAIYGIAETEEADPEPEPEAPKRLTVDPAGFRALFTQAEKVAITEAGMTDAMVRVFMDDATVAPVIDLAYPPVVMGIQYLVSKGLITPERSTEILAGEVQNEV